MMTLGDLDLFNGKVKFGNLGFSMGKSENSGFFRNYSTVQVFFHQPAHLRGEGATIKRISPPRKPPAGGGLGRIRGVSVVGFTDKN